jgi:lipoate-protein ligase A
VPNPGSSPNLTRHGEFKTPGGKLIAVEFDVENGVLRHVVVTGDFFLYPEEALGLLAGSLEGISASLRDEDYAARVAAVLNGDVELLGSSPEALATAVVRALHDAEAAEGADGA